MATPPDMDSGRYFWEVRLAWWGKVMPARAVASAKTGKAGSDFEPSARAANDPEIAPRNERRFISIHVEDFFHTGPPLARLSGFERLLHGLHKGPPLLGLGVGRHLCRIRLVVRTMVFEIAKEVIVLEINRVIWVFAF